MHCRRDDWWGQRFDNWGNPRERGWLADATGRSPSKQLNADAMEHLLLRRREVVRVSRIVLFTPPRAACGTFESPTVDLMITSTADVVAVAEAKPDALSTRQQEILEKLIRRDHRFHERRAQ